MFSYAGQRIAVLAVSDRLYEREYPALASRYNMPRLGDALVLGIMYAVSSGTSHSAQYALAAMFKAACDGELDFVAATSEYARRAALTKKMFVDNGFHIVYALDGDEPVSDGFFYTVGYRLPDGTEMTGAALMRDLMLMGICSISLSDRKHTERSPHLRLPAEPPRAVLPPGGALEPLRHQPSVISLPFWASSPQRHRFCRLSPPRHRVLPRKECIANSRSRFSRFPFPRHTLFAGFPCIANRKQLFGARPLSDTGFCPEKSVSRAEAGRNAVCQI